ncbi:glycoside hydrolase family 24 protein [Geminocystis herdmanii]|uniref:glycoside hydrolase family 24 protein n=1 Tax=Geminocystis herdmanii TaxID=669359 RepID=UPI00034A5A91|nr:glycoside hydrolase family protein [Geminocystis herdmanii]
MKSIALSNQKISKKLKRQKNQGVSLFSQGWKISLVVLLCILVVSIFKTGKEESNNSQQPFPELAMTGGDTYIRALMRTISASESNGKYPYALIYGGKHIHSFEQHPNKCVSIEIGVNRGKCSTAAGRYQFLTSTWEEKARKYHPEAKKHRYEIVYSFEPEYQDIVVYRWLKDHHQWDVEILTLLKQDRVEEVLAKLSGVWTSLGGGIEDNSMTPYLPQLYRQFLGEELKNQKK